MNEQHFAEQIRVLLDASSEQLPYRVSHRLESGRQAALARMPAAGAVLSAAGAAGRANVGIDEEPASRGRRATIVVSMMILIAGLIAISIWSDLEMADETADIDMAVLTDDDVPISAYADRGFGVFLKNSRQ